MAEHDRQTEDKKLPEDPVSRVLSLRKTTRRGFLGLLGTLSASAVLPILPGDGFIAATGTQKQKEHPQEETEINMGIIKVILDADKKPKSYVINYSERIDFTEEEKLQLAEARKKAYMNGESEPALQFREFSTVPMFLGTPEKPVVTELPEDVLTPEQLQEFDVEIINPSSDESSHLYLRDDIFKNQGILESHVVMNQLLPEGKKQKLVIVVFDGEFVTQEYLQSSEYEAVREFLNPMIASGETKEEGDLAAQLQTAVETYRQNKFAELWSELISKKNGLNNLDRSSFEFQQLQSQILEIKSKILLYSKTLDDSELIAEAFEYFKRKKREGTAIGEFHYSKESTPDTSYIFLAAPNPRDTATQTVHTLVYLPDASLGFTSFTREPDYGASAPNVSQSFTSPEELRDFEGDQKKGNNYRVANKNSGVVVEHELAHYVLMKTVPTLARLNALDQSQSAQVIRNIPEIDRYIDFENNGKIDKSQVPMISSEWLTDTVAKTFLLRDYRRWEETGFTDYSSVFPVVYSVPSSRVQPQGGYQLTNFSGKVVQTQATA